MQADNDIISRKDILEFSPGFVGKTINALIAPTGSINIGIAGGRTVPDVVSRSPIEWKRTEAFVADERLVPLDDRESNFRNLKDALQGKARLHPFSLEKGIKDYERELREQGGAYDAVVLSAGEDGHIAGLFPNGSVLDESEYFVEFHDSPKPPRDRMSMSRKLLLRSELGIVLFIGEEKRAALEMFLDKDARWEDCPAKLVLQLPVHYALTDIEL